MLFLNSAAALGAAVFAGFAAASNKASWDDYYKKDYISYSTVTGFFQQDDPATVPGTFNYATSNLGLIDRKFPTDKGGKPVATLTSWQRFEAYVESLNKKNDQYTYKVLFMGRHGQGFHNAAESYFGTPAWNCYYSILEGNSTVTWADAHLTTDGITQAQIAANFWANQISKQKQTPPQSFYVSPLYRCLDTARITFEGLSLPAAHPFIPTVKENLREGISGHTCDRRSSASYIHKNFPTYVFESGFNENDLLFQELRAEAKTDEDLRSKKALDDIFRQDSNVFVSITSHSGDIASLLRVLGHRVFSLSTGQVIPVLAKAQIKSGPSPTTAYEPWETISTCATPPAKTA